MNRILLEVCTDTVGGPLTAFHSGADRLELNSSLDAGGLTPSIGLVHEVIRLVDVPVIVMVRPRPGGFVYAVEDIEVIRRDIEEALDAGAAGIAIGFLTVDGVPDETLLLEMRRRTPGKELVFHRAFDTVTDQENALEVLMSAGVDRVLTSGARPTAMEGARRIGELIAFADGRITLMPGSGVTPANAAEVVRLTGCGEIHGSFSRSIEPLPAVSPVEFPPSGRMTDPALIIRTRRNLDIDLNGAAPPGRTVRADPVRKGR